MAVFTTARYRTRMISSTPRIETNELAERTEASASAILTLEGFALARAASAAVVEGVDAAPVLRRRLLEAGFTAGSPVRFVMATPFGDPLVFSLRGASIALRKAEARCVRVRV